jgi:hypothetical protein
MIYSGSVTVQARKRSALLVILGCVSLSAGLLVYPADRVASHAVLVPSIATLGGRNLFGALGQWLPSFVHPLAFSLFTATVLKPGAAACWGACTFWGLVNVVFEAGQHPALAVSWTAALHGAAGDSPIVRAMLNYFLHGTFDPYDVFAATLGALAAAAVLQLVDHFQGGRHVSN